MKNAINLYDEYEFKKIGCIYATLNEIRKNEKCSEFLQKTTLQTIFIIACALCLPHFKQEYRLSDIDILSLIGISKAQYDEIRVKAMQYASRNDIKTLEYFTGDEFCCMLDEIADNSRYQDLELASLENLNYTYLAEATVKNTRGIQLPAEEEYPLLKEYKAQEYKTKEKRTSKNTSIYTKEKSLPSEDKKILYKYGEFLDEKNFITNPAIGRNDEIRRLMKTMLNPTKSLIITGEAGVGKTAVVEGFAYLLQKKEAPDLLKDYKVYNIKTSALVNGCIYVGMFEERVEELFSIIKQYPNIILNIDEIHTAFGLGKGSKGVLDFANILKPYLDRGDIKVIGTTTENEYNEFIKNDEAFCRRFHRLNVFEPNEKDIFEILNIETEKLNEKMNIKFNFNEQLKKEILDIIINTTNKKHRIYNDNQNNPDLSLSILTDAYTNAAMDNRDILNIDDISIAIRDCSKIYDSARVEAVLTLEGLKSNKDTDQQSNKVKGKIIKFPN